MRKIALYVGWGGLSQVFDNGNGHTKIPPNPFDLAISNVPYSAARIIARIPARIAGGSLGQASTTAAKSGDSSAFWASSAPLSAPLWFRTPVLSVFSGGGSTPSWPMALACRALRSDAAMVSGAANNLRPLLLRSQSQL